MLYYLGTVRVICQKEENLGRLELTLLGPFHASLDGEAITAFKSNKVRALLAYLAVEAGRPQRRAALAALLSIFLIYIALPNSVIPKTSRNNIIIMIAVSTVVWPLFSIFISLDHLTSQSISGNFTLVTDHPYRHPLFAI